MGGVSYKTNNSKLKLNLLHIQNGESSAGSFFQSRFDTDFINLKKDNLEYTERAISNLLFSGTMTIMEIGKLKVNQQDHRYKTRMQEPHLFN